MTLANFLIKVIRRRRKKKKLNEKPDGEVFPQSPDIDSGYFNGPESSSELTSETELFSGRKTSNMKSISKLLTFSL